MLRDALIKRHIARKKSSIVYHNYDGKLFPNSALPRKLVMMAQISASQRFRNFLLRAKQEPRELVTPIKTILRALTD